MKTIRHLCLVLGLFFLLSLVSGQNCGNISGQVTYLNNASTPLYDVLVQLQTTGGEVLQTTTTDYLGRYFFCLQAEGTYQVKCTSSRPAGGINSTDALIALRAFMGLDPLAGLTRKAADVNASGYINTTDALLILQRYVGPNTTFPAGDWVFESGNATLSGGNSIILNLKGLCYGDLDGNFIPAGCSPMPTLAHAGADQTITGSSTTLAGNVPQSGSGVWAIVSGTGGAVAQTGNPTSTFTGTAENTYTLTWTISTSCTQSTDTVIITFNNPIMAIPCPGIPSFSYGGQTYNTVQIGSQCWMKENLNMGTMIDGMTNASDNGIIEKYCYNNDPANCTIYGGLYDWNEMMGYANMPGTQGICPTGWHIPTDGEWCTLTTFLDATVNCNIWGWSGTNAGGKLKETGTIHWNSPNTGATNESGFTALGTGYLYFNGFFSNLNYLTYFWSSSEGSTSGGIHRYLLYVLAKVYRYDVDKTYGFSVRCVLTN